MRRYINAFSNEPQRPKMYLRTCAASEDSDQPAHSRSLIRILSGRILDSQGCKVSSCGQRRLWSDCADAQADLSLRLEHISEGTFSHVAAPIIVGTDLFFSWFILSREVLNKFPVDLFLLYHSYQSGTVFFYTYSGTMIKSIDWNEV